MSHLRLEALSPIAPSAPRPRLPRHSEMLSVLYLMEHARRLARDARADTPQALSKAPTAQGVAGSDERHVASSTRSWIA